MKILFILGILAALLYIIPIVFAETTFFEGESEGFVVLSNNTENVTEYCGDSLCGTNESCKSCVIDCGDCVENVSLEENVSKTESYPTKKIFSNEAKSNVSNNSGETSEEINYGKYYIMGLGIFVLLVALIIYIIRRRK